MNIPETPIAKKRDYNFTLNFIDDSFAIDGELQVANLEQESLRCPYLMNRYSTMLSMEERHYGILETEKDVLYRNLWLYYSGKAPDDVYKAKPFDYKVLKGDIDFWIKADDTMIELQKKMVSSKARLSKLNNIVRNIQYRHSQIKNSIDELKRKQGG